MKSIGSSNLFLALLIALACACISPAQTTGFRSEYLVRREVTLSGSAEAVTVQLPAASSRYVRFARVQVWCSTGNVDVSIYRDGTAATTTAATITKKNPNASWMSNPVAQAFVASNVGTGTQVGTTQTAYSSTSGLVLDIGDYILEKGAAAVQNLTVQTANYTGTVRIQISWEERPNI